MASLSIKELKQRLTDQGIPLTGLIEKQDLIKALPSTDRMSTSELKDLIRSLAGRTNGIFERIDLLNRLCELIGSACCSICLDHLLLSKEKAEPHLVHVSCCPLVKGVYHEECLQTYVCKMAEEGRWPVLCIGCSKALDEFVVKCRVFRGKEDHPVYVKYLRVVAKLKELRNGRDTGLDPAVLRELDPKLFRQCPKCKVLIEKGPAREIFTFEIPGCNKMTCRCGHQFCFKCGADRDKCNCTGAEHDFFSHHDVMTDYPGARFMT